MIKQIARFLVAGGAAVTADFTTFILLRWLGAPLILANAIAFTLAFLIGFAINRHWTFEAAGDPGRQQFVRYGAVAITGLVLNTAVLAALVGLSSAEIPAKVAATIASAMLNFLLSRSWVFS